MPKLPGVRLPRLGGEEARSLALLERLAAADQQEEADQPHDGEDDDAAAAQDRAEDAVRPVQRRRAGPAFLRPVRQSAPAAGGRSSPRDLAGERCLSPALLRVAGRNVPGLAAIGTAARNCSRLKVGFAPAHVGAGGVGHRGAVQVEAPQPPGRVVTPDPGFEVVHLPAQEADAGPAGGAVDVGLGRAAEFAVVRARRGARRNRAARRRPSRRGSPAPGGRRPTGRRAGTEVRPRLPPILRRFTRPQCSFRSGEPRACWADRVKPLGGGQIGRIGKMNARRSVH